MQVKPTLYFLACVLLVSVSGACGSGCGQGHEASRQPASTVASAALPQIEIKSDVDLDSDSYPDGPPDNEHAAFGRPAGAAQRQAVAAVVGRYYADAARADGAAACGLVYSTRAESASEDYADVLPPAKRRGASCAAVLSALFRRLHGRLSAPLRVGSVRVEFNSASVQLHFRGQRSPRYIEAHRERGAWKLGMLLDTDRTVGVE
jgi:hypothetical protein